MSHLPDHTLVWEEIPPLNLPSYVVTSWGSSEITYYIHKMKRPQQRSQAGGEMGSYL